MTSEQARKLKPGTRVVWADGSTGTVKYLSPFCVNITWDDGGETGLHPDDCEYLRLARSWTLRPSEGQYQGQVCSRPARGRQS